MGGGAAHQFVTPSVCDLRAAARSSRRVMNHKDHALSQKGRICFRQTLKGFASEHFTPTGKKLRDGCLQTGFGC
jgi:hypothetical protein